MLDDLKYIHEKDGQDALGKAEKQWQQLEHKYNLNNIDTSLEIKNVVFAGMGGSALAAYIARSWPGLEVPFELVRDYTIPSYVSVNTLFIASSYSGNTEETVEALQFALQKGAQVVIISAGGKLKDIANQGGYPYLQMPEGFQPRFATLYNFKALVTVLQAYGLIDEEHTNAEISKATESIKSCTKLWRADVKTVDNEAKQIALEISGKTPVIYAGGLLAPVAYKWKISFNENAKNVAWYNQFPEFNHNEFLGWTSHPIDKPYYVIELMSNLEHARTQKRFEVSNRLLSGRWPSPYLVKPSGHSVFEQIVYTMVLGDFVSLYLALLNGLNPSPVELIEKLKDEMNK